MPLGPVNTAIVGLECQFAVSLFFASGENVAAVGGCQAVFLIGIWRAVNLYVLFLVVLLFRITWCTAVECEADGVENGRLAASCWANDAEDGTVAQGSFYEVDDLASLSVERGKMEYFKLYEFHVSR